MSTGYSGGADERVELTLAINESDQVRDISSGVVPVNGVRLRTVHHEVEEIFFRFTKFREWEITELSLAKYCSLRGAGDDSVVGLPVFPSRSFRHSGIYVRADGPVDNPSALVGARIGFPEWTVTATVYQRALLQSEFGIDLTGIDWVQGGINEPGRIETLPVGLPDGVSVRAERERSLNQLMLDGDLDAMVVPHAPEAAEDGSGRIVQLFSDVRAVEEDYYRRTGIFPIMHLLVMRKDIFDRYPWLAPNLVTAFTEAKDRSVKRMLSGTAPHIPVPWGPTTARAATKVLGPDLWPYGVDANLKTLEAFMTYAHEQRLTKELLKVEDLFPSSVLESFRI
ncbi:4,5-dihydroxyphthalate decarboxylase [Glaciibacter superstes]|uniref:4,5-dihydroxyphthalate decarboxylase n=1 Tax=Glaciibacter superstes TaxID=501023 RepID=UPI0003B3012A|nr:4,5-dihydroxyphthalate decarboxylase [Glaciibacter superstes]